MSHQCFGFDCGFDCGFTVEVAEGGTPGSATQPGERVWVIDETSIYWHQLGEIRSVIDAQGRFRVHLDGMGRYRRIRTLPLIFGYQLKIDPRPSPYTTEEPLHV